MLATDTDVAWGGGIFHYLRGMIVDVPPGSALETAYGGPSNLVALDAPTAQAISGGAVTVVAQAGGA
jgi:hypothetical protein